MAEETPSKPPAPKGPSPILLIAAVAGGLVVGAAVGGFVVGPQIVAARTPRAGAAQDAESDQAKDRDDGKRGKESGDKPAYYQIDNIIVNPAGSQGARFLMASVAIELTDSKLDERLKAHEVELRDAVISTLERQTMAMLNRPGARDSVRVELEAKIRPFAQSSRPLHVYLPQFVVQ